MSERNPQGGEGGRDTAGAAQPAARRPTPETMLQVRASDIEPYTELRYLSKLFRIMAIMLVLLLVAEVVTGFISQGMAALPTLLAEASKLIVSAALLWAIGDLVILLIDVGHDVRAARILLGRQAAHQLAGASATAAHGVGGERGSDTGELAAAGVRSPR